MSKLANRFKERSSYGALYSSRNTSEIMNDITYNRNVLQLSFYTLVFLAAGFTITSTSYSYPLFPFQSDSLDWCKNWLVATVIDYYGAALCLCGVILSSEETWFQGLMWTTGCLLLGSPICCLWVLLWLKKSGGSLRLERHNSLLLS